MGTEASVAPLSEEITARSELARRPEEHWERSRSTDQEVLDSTFASLWVLTMQFGVFRPGEKVLVQLVHRKTCAGMALGGGGVCDFAGPFFFFGAGPSFRRRWSCLMPSMERQNILCNSRRSLSHARFEVRVTHLFH